jgi:hypothetical protein
MVPKGTGKEVATKSEVVLRKQIWESNTIS